MGDRLIRMIRAWIRRRPHCWAGDPDREPGTWGDTCMRLDGHLGAHKYMPDSEITVRFS